MPLTMTWPLALPTAPPLGAKPLGKLRLPVALEAPPMLAVEPLIG